MIFYNLYETYVAGGQLMAELFKVSTVDKCFMVDGRIREVTVLLAEYRNRVIV
jgi:hypothetical protein